MSAKDFLGVMFTPHGPDEDFGFVLRDGTPVEEAANGPKGKDPNPFLQAFIDIWKQPIPEEEDEVIADTPVNGQTEDEISQ